MEDHSMPAAWVILLLRWKQFDFVFSFFFFPYKIAIEKKRTKLWNVRVDCLKNKTEKYMLFKDLIALLVRGRVCICGWRQLMTLHKEWSSTSSNMQRWHPRGWARLAWILLIISEQFGVWLYKKCIRNSVASRSR